MTAYKKDGITVQKGGQIIKFDIRVETPKGVLWCAYIKQLQPESKLAAGMISNRVSNKTVKSMKELTLAIKMNFEQAHAILGHLSKEKVADSSSARYANHKRRTQDLQA